jgi:hypothetical protein
VVERTQLDDNGKKAFDFAADSTKQLITLATGILTLTVTFAKNFFASATVAVKTAAQGDVPETTRTVATTDIPDVLKVVIIVAWALYVVSIIFGLLSLSAWTSELEKRAQDQTTRMPSIWVSSAVETSKYQQILFLVATVLVAVFGGLALWS